jgi:hypothetical protein
MYVYIALMREYVCASFRAPLSVSSANGVCILSLLYWTHLCRFRALSTASVARALVRSWARSACECECECERRRRGRRRVRVESGGARRRRVERPQDRKRVRRCPPPLSSSQRFLSLSSLPAAIPTTFPTPAPPPRGALDALATFCVFVSLLFA